MMDQRALALPLHPSASYPSCQPESYMSTDRSVTSTGAEDEMLDHLLFVAGRWLCFSMTRPTSNCSSKRGVKHRSKMLLKRIVTLESSFAFALPAIVLTNSLQYNKHEERHCQDTCPCVLTEHVRHSQDCRHVAQATLSLSICKSKMHANIWMEEAKPKTFIPGGRIWSLTCTYFSIFAEHPFRRRQALRGRLGACARLGPREFAFGASVDSESL